MPLTFSTLEPKFGTVKIDNPLPKVEKVKNKKRLLRIYSIN